jgi:hypothetical protein
MTLRNRLGILWGIYGALCPTEIPIPLGQLSPALRQLGSQPFLVSFVPIGGFTPCRKGLECVAISLYRQEHQRSPTVNFGRMPLG